MYIHLCPRISQKHTQGLLVNICQKGLLILFIFTNFTFTVAPGLAKNIHKVCQKELFIFFKELHIPHSPAVDDWHFNFALFTSMSARNHSCIANILSYDLDFGLNWTCKNKQISLVTSASNADVMEN